MIDSEVPRPMLAPNPRMRWRIQRIGNHRAFVIDNFYKFPDAVRELALSLDYTNHRRLVAHFPGVRATIALSTLELQSALHNFVDSNLVLADSCDGIWMFSVVTDTLRSAGPQSVPHADRAIVSGLIWLSLQNKGGTGFYQHRETGLEALPNPFNQRRVDRIVKKLKLHSQEELFDRILRPSKREGFITRSNADWRLLTILRAKYNRAVIFPSKLFHSQYVEDGWYGKTLETRRLTQTFFFVPRPT